MHHLPSFCSLFASRDHIAFSDFSSHAMTKEKRNPDHQQQRNTEAIKEKPNTNTSIFPLSPLTQTKKIEHQEPVRNDGNQKQTLFRVSPSTNRSLR
jgi:hypothetical protein